MQIVMLALSDNSSEKLTCNMTKQLEIVKTGKKARQSANPSLLCPQEHKERTIYVPGFIGRRHIVFLGMSVCLPDYCLYVCT